MFCHGLFQCACDAAWAFSEPDYKTRVKSSTPRPPPGSPPRPEIRSHDNRSDASASTLTTISALDQMSTVMRIITPCAISPFCFDQKTSSRRARANINTLWIQSSPCTPHVAFRPCNELLHSFHPQRSSGTMRFSLRTALRCCATILALVASSSAHIVLIYCYLFVFFNTRLTMLLWVGSIAEQVGSYMYHSGWLVCCTGAPQGQSSTLIGACQQGYASPL